MIYIAPVIGYVGQNKEDLDKIAIAIDGPAGSGKSTIAKMLAERLGYLYLDTGAMYRALTLIAIEEGIDPSDGSALEARLHDLDIRLLPNKTLIGERDISAEIRTPEVDALVSQVCAHPEVRREMVRRQRAIAHNENVIMEGRDIGTVVMPDASLKIFLTASPKERARRRAKQLEKAGVEFDIETLEHDIIQRDTKDSTRADSPLRKAEDAIEIDDTGDSIWETLSKIESLLANITK